MARPDHQRFSIVAIFERQVGSLLCFGWPSVWRALWWPSIDSRSSALPSPGDASLAWVQPTSTTSSPLRKSQTPTSLNRAPALCCSSWACCLSRKRVTNKRWIATTWARYPAWHRGCPAQSLHNRQSSSQTWWVCPEQPSIPRWCREAPWWHHLTMCSGHLGKLAGPALTNHQFGDDPRLLPHEQRQLAVLRTALLRPRDIPVHPHLFVVYFGASFEDGILEAWLGHLPTQRPACGWDCVVSHRLSMNGSRVPNRSILVKPLLPWSSQPSVTSCPTSSVTSSSSSTTRRPSALFFELPQLRLTCWSGLAASSPAAPRAAGVHLAWMGWLSLEPFCRAVLPGPFRWGDFVPASPGIWLPTHSFSR